MHLDSGVAASVNATGRPPTDRTRVRRHPERAVYDRDFIHAILDEGLVCHLGFVDQGAPVVIPAMYARAGENLYLHGAPASRLLGTLASGAQVSLAVTLLDGLVLARSAFHHSMNFRSAVVFGRAVEVTDPAEKQLAFEALVEHVAGGRWGDVRRPNAKELGATRVLRLGLDEASAKVRLGGPKDDEADLGLEVWAGVIPLALSAAAPRAAADLKQGIAVPAYADPYRRQGVLR